VRPSQSSSSPTPGWVPPPRPAAAAALHTPSTLNAIADDDLRARVEAIVGHATGAVASGQPPLAAFITVGVLKRVKKYISEMDSAQRSGWGEQAALARAVAELTGSPLGVPPNDAT
jgi:hypothetical protein